MTLHERLRKAFNQPHWKTWQARTGAWPIDDLITDVMGAFDAKLHELGYEGLRKLLREESKR